jgi:RNA polymerase sigma-70 factor (sigma-E family)
VNDARSSSEAPVIGEMVAVDRPVGDAGATTDFTAWVTDYQRPLLAFAQLVAGNRETGEDLLQTALARAYLKWPKIGAPGQHPHSYVRRIIVNENASLWRRAWKRRERSTGAIPESDAVAPTLVDSTWALVQSLPVRQRTAIALRFYADLSVTETADVMGCSEGTVKTHTSRALATLKAALIEGGRDD